MRYRFSMTFNKGFDDIQFGLFKNYDLNSNFDIYGRTITTCQTCIEPPLHLIEAAAMHANSGLTKVFSFDEFPECSSFEKVKENRINGES